ncbi:MAG: PEP-CTERM sorting domain-containing protein [Candidatus Omnitrophota bacterium]
MRKAVFILLGMILIAGCSGSGGGGSSVSGFSSSSSSYGATTTGASGAPLVNPEPTTLALLGIGLAGLAAAKFRKKR